ncbi:MAG: hypothetical protein BECKG1743D_GA0114223_100891 [Candidatus Kentron sp. G]|nr:MAG: hypothetical protein BECKG1743F_GA0114225_100612 [Candidatus Kentron sp. G]VFM96455.1 MAG: hypothetical protein BECKG1743E_GA0114224_100622 [Candidatus Kentron sp. G]VFM98873.1 MAG: hypothetical protein BECKG1743D_GA0114223_100891 [Candidatus Kentron sp. G]
MVIGTFPLEESKIFTLGQAMSGGFKANTGIYPAPPVDTTTLDDALANYVALRDAAIAAQSAAEQATAASRRGFRPLRTRSSSICVTRR